MLNENKLGLKKIFKQGFSWLHTKQGQSLYMFTKNGERSSISCLERSDWSAGSKK